jgi:hypothetical protein
MVKVFKPIAQRDGVMKNGWFFKNSAPDGQTLARTDLFC